MLFFSHSSHRFKSLYFPVKFQSFRLFQYLHHILTNSEVNIATLLHIFNDNGAFVSPSVSEF